VSERDFIAAQAVRVNRTAADGTTRVYRLSGLVECGFCGRRMDSHWVNGRAGYRCRHGYTSARPRPVGGLKNLYPHEDYLLARVAAHLNGGGGPARDVAGHLRAQGFTISCDIDTLALRNRRDQPTSLSRSWS
jgi:hypothetical protein